VTPTEERDRARTERDRARDAIAKIRRILTSYRAGEETERCALMAIWNVVDASKKRPSATTPRKRATS